MNTLLLRVGLLAFAIGGTLITVPLWQAPERGWSFTYNATGFLESSDGPRTDVSDITRYEYDSNSNLMRIINALGHTIEMSNYDYIGNPQTIVDPNGVVTSLTYMPQGWLSSVSVGDSTTQFDYNATGDITRLTQGDGSWLAYTWDDARRLVRITNNLTEQAELELDPMGNQTVVRLKDNAGELTKQHRWVYDELGRLLDSVGASGQASHLQYDLNGNPITTVTPRDSSYSSAYDPLNRLIKSTDPLNGTSQFEYDAQDNLTHVRDARGVSTQYHFDGLGNLTQLDSPDSGTSKYKYDAAGNITEKTDARGVVTSFAYDALNRLISRRYPANPTLDVRFYYDSITKGNKGIGRLTAVEDINGVLSYTYDAQGNRTDQLHTPRTDGATQLEKLGFGYDGANRLSRIDYPTGFSIHYLRNSAGQVSQVQIRRDAGEPTTFVRDIAYLPFGPLKSLAWNNGTTLQRTYDLDYRLTAQTVAGWSNTYAYDAIGNITKVQSNSVGELNYSYDPLDRLTEEANATRHQTFTYDAVGNRTNKTLTPQVDGKVQDSAVTTYQYGASNNRLIQIDDHLVSTDAAGNLIKDRVNRQFSYDQQNRLSSVKIDGMIRAQFRYNALGQRTQKITPQGVTKFLYGPDGQLLGETMFNSEGKKLESQYYFWLDGLPLGGVSINYDSAGALTNSNPFYIHSDHLNTPRIVTNAVQEIVWEWKSDAFGLEKTSGYLTLNLRFPGQYYDAETGLHYNYFRNYDPEIGRYLESDPTGLKGGMNTYGYVNGNPLKFVDPFGLESVFEWSSKAENIAKRSELPGEYNGPQDAYRHCVASCMIAASNWGESTSRLAGWAHEVSNFGQNKYERAMDDWNNQAGLCAAKDSKSPDDCPKSCMTLLENNALIMEATSHGAYY
ncbi:RHS repeat-associated core domain-containing protein [Pseudomonas sp. P9_31]|uniref:RHS repeat-associated core domain-containing protein n=1 Tax=Pseudomonas sp. P9_31 TaxID=3043448 RepID=UPI002A360616|nr:RHS repeat-associated core domain-containing protein [Pseudomonas sp. P9_31]WPN57971.1 RHS repeat-associated core domain-containing protein [Pseudomonas sp. P9_31]